MGTQEGRNVYSSRRPAGAEPGTSMAHSHHIQSGFFNVPSNST
ncbi:hypothetical protein D4764_11G0000840 [Takifugu flavidus]|uniref:Uncharacterized protein n=1 Tax=Takifugu flavidus TaxID=433684 RepID=A0A5C6PEL0_9TELE|nr:hypothetical protein D4764_11G0000840 [Takifugu flavidus]